MGGLDRRVRDRGALGPAAMRGKRDFRAATRPDHGAHGRAQDEAQGREGAGGAVRPPENAEARGLCAHSAVLRGGKRAPGESEVCAMQDDVQSVRGADQDRRQAVPVPAPRVRVAGPQVR